MSVIELKDDSEFAGHLSDAGDQKLVVVVNWIICNSNSSLFLFEIFFTIKDFSAVWCGPCTAIAPFYKSLSTKYPSVMFLKVDVDKCPGTAAAYNVTSMPTFIFLRNRSVLDRLRGGDKNALENKVKQHLKPANKDDAENGNGNGIPGLDGDYVTTYLNLFN